MVWQIVEQGGNIFAKARNSAFFTDVLGEYCALYGHREKLGHIIMNELNWELLKQRFPEYFV